MKFNYENLHRKSPKPLWFRTFLRRYLNRFALLVAEEGLEPNTVQKRAALFVVYSVREFVQCPLRCPKKSTRSRSAPDFFDRGSG